MKKTILIFMLHLTAAFFILTGFACSSADEGNGDLTETGYGLYVENGTLMKDNEPYYGMGINYFRLFNDYVAGDASTLRGLAELAAKGVPFVRFPASPYWPASWTATYFTDKEAYFKKLDKIVELAEKLGIGLIPSLFWHMPTFPDLMGEHMDAFGDSGSRTTAFVRQYTQEVVERYKDSPAIWGWEFGNEFNLFVDIPHVSTPPNPPGLGCPAERDPVRDRFYNRHMTNAFKEFGAAVRRYDTHRAIFSGNSEPRPAAWHNALYDPTQYWAADTYDQYRDIISRFECNPINTVTIRAYCNYGVADTRYPLGIKNPSDYVAAMMKIAGELGKPLFIGEFTASDSWKEYMSEEYEVVQDIEGAFRARMEAIVDNRVQLSAVWVYDLPQQDGSCSITPDNHRSYMLDEIAKANSDLRRIMPQN